MLDPMAGTGSTGIIASILGRNAILVELEEKFIGFINANLEKSRKQVIFGAERGWVKVIHEDARNLSGLLEKVDTIVSSPPYAETKSFQDKDFMLDNAEKQINNVLQGKTKGHPATPEARKRVFERMSQGELNDPENIGNLHYGHVDAILSSPPYANRLSDATVHDGDKARMSYRQTIDAVITSPPYANQVHGDSKKERRRKAERYAKGDFQAKRPDIFSSTTNLGGGATFGGYSESKDNIGNLKADSYLAAMKTVYTEYWKVLKPNGKMVLITKNFIRNKKVVRLDLDTVKLCEAVGFRFLEWHRFRLPNESFWRVNYRKKYPEVEAILHEDILVFEKQPESSQEHRISRFIERSILCEMPCGMSHCMVSSMR